MIFRIAAAPRRRCHVVNMSKVQTGLAGRTHRRATSAGMPTIMIRQLDALSKILERTTDESRREVLLAEAFPVKFCLLNREGGRRAGRHLLCTVGQR
ncbi:hypothetical protein [Streptomyces sp. NPDC020681]|uniref:hypothetical protein n=1 Tax=Streptomyces sp. NPDC020681 TaxID=3365083 RepID=UPI00379BAEB5